jgi:gliding motility-associated protein GldC
MNKEIMKTSNITIKIGLDPNQLPVSIKWHAEDNGLEEQAAEAFLLSIWDKKEKNTLKIDLWTPEMSVEEMKQFFHQTLLSMSDTFEKATGEHLMAEDLRDYCYHFAEKMNILPKE